MIVPTLDSIDLKVFRKYAGVSLPRHVSYPMPTWWQDMNAADADQMRAASRARPNPRDLALYVHIPFCEKLCRYCACTRIAQPRCEEGAPERTEAYVGALEREIRDLPRTLGEKTPLRQIHWGGGTPTYLTPREIERLHTAITDSFALADDAEIAMELDPRVTTRETLETLRRLGFNRASLGVQDFDPRVQEHVQRIQPVEMVRQMVEQCRELGFVSVNFDLIYGLPYQTLETVQRTLEQTIAIGPDRIAYYLYAQIPDKIATQRGLDLAALPDSEVKLEMFLLGHRVLSAAGYEFIGLDHFAKPSEALAKARQSGRLQRNFQGMTTGGDLDLIGVGASSISQLDGIGFLQNTREPGAYTAKMSVGTSAVVRGKRLTDDDCVRQALLRQLYCHAAVDSAALEQEFGIHYDEYFVREINILHELQRDGLVKLTPDDGFEVTFPLGRVLMRTLGGVFDAYLPPDAYLKGAATNYSANA